MTRLALLGLLKLAMACANDSQSRMIAPRDLRNVITNPNAIKLPIHTTLSAPSAHWRTVGDSCETPAVRATAWDDNNRQIDDALGVWTSDDTSIAVVDSLGWAHAAHCGPPTVTDTGVVVGIRFTLLYAKGQ